MADAGTELAKGIVSEITPAGSDWLGLLGSLLMPKTQPAAKQPPPRGPLPRIVPNAQGELVDLNTGKVVGRVGERRSSLADEIRANMELERQGSIMARPEKPQWRKDSPLLDSILGALDQMLSVANPVENIGGPSGAVLGPIGRTASKAVNQAQKHVAKAIFRADPSQLKAVVEDPRMLRLSTPTKPGLQAMLKSGDYPGEALATYRGSSTMPLGTMTVPPTTLRGLDPSGLRNTLANVPQTALHETQHFLNQPRIYTTETALGKVHPQSGALFDLLSPYLSGGAKQAARQGALRNMNPAIAVDEALAYLSGMGTRNPQTEDVGKLLYEKLKNLPGQARQPLSVERVGGAIEAAKQESPLEQGLIDYIQSAFKRATAGFSPPMENLY